LIILIGKTHYGMLFHASSITFSAFSFTALPKVLYAWIISFNLKRWVINFLASSFLDCTFLKSIGVVTVSTSRVVMVIFLDHKVSSYNSTLLPCTPMLAMHPPGGDNGLAQFKGRWHANRFNGCIYSWALPIAVKLNFSLINR